MKAVTVDEYGAEPALTDVPEPQAGPGQVLIRVKAAGINPMDEMITAGNMQARMPGTFPMILGADLAGVIESAGNGSSKFSTGDVVFGQLMIAPLGSAGTYAEFVAAAEDAPLALVPDGLDPVDAAALPTAGVTALQIVDSLEPLNAKTVLIVGAAGGVGSFATQLAVNAGAQVIAVVSGSAAARMRDYGVSQTVDYKAGPVPEAVRSLHADGVDVLIDLASDAEAFASLATLVRPGGTALTTRGAADAEALASNQVTGVNFGVHVTPAGLARLADQVVGNRITMPPLRRISLGEAPALDGDGHADGKTVIVLAGEEPTQLSSERYQRPGWFTRHLFNGAVAALTRIGVSVAGSRVLEIRGRKTGLPRRTPVNLLTLAGTNYLVSPRGNTQWVRNLRAQGEGRLLLGRHAEPFTAAELSDEDKVPILRAYLKRWKWEVGAFFGGVGPDSPDAELRRIAHDHPIFRIERSAR